MHIKKCIPGSWSREIHCDEVNLDSMANLEAKALGEVTRAESRKAAYFPAMKGRRVVSDVGRWWISYSYSILKSIGSK